MGEVFYKRNFLRVIGFLVVAGLALPLAPVNSGQQTANNRRNLTTEERDRVRGTLTAIGLVSVRRAGEAAQEPRPRGSAVIIRQDGVVVTNYHVIREDKEDRLYDEIFLSLPGGESADRPMNRYRLQVVLISKNDDLALLRIAAENASNRPATFPVVELGDARKARLLDDLIVIGYPEKGGASVTVNLGVIEGKDALENWIKTDARLIHGNSGGAAVNAEGKLIGIPTKVIADKQAIDKDGDGFPDEVQVYGAVGFLRPAYLIAALLEKFDEAERQVGKANPQQQAKMPMQVTPLTALIVVRGTVKSATGATVAGAKVGLLIAGSKEVTPDSLMAWCGTNGEGQFEMNRPIPPGRYTLRVKAIGYAIFTRDVEIDQNTARFMIALQPQ